MFFPAMERTKDRRRPPSVSTFAQRVLIEGGPQRRFGYFAAVGKVTLASPPRRAELSSRKTSLCSAAPTAAH